MLIERRNAKIMEDLREVLRVPIDLCSTGERTNRD